MDEFGYQDELALSTVGLLARIGETETLKHALKCGADCEVPDNRGWFPLHEAAFSNHTECLKALLSHDINVNRRAHDGSTALLLACQRGHYNAAQLLLQSGADPNIGTTDQMLPLIAAVNPGGNQSLVRLLLEHKSSVNKTYWNGWSSLHEAAHVGNESILIDLLNAGANPRSRDSDGISPVFTACQYGHADCLRMLLKSCVGAKEMANCCTDDGTSCVYICAQEGYDDCLRTLLEYDADVNQVTSSGIHPIVAAVKRNFTRCTRLILEHASLSSMNSSLEDAVFVAVEEKSTWCLELLVRAGCALDRLTETETPSAPIAVLADFFPRSHLSPLGLAVRNRQTDAIRVLLAAEAKRTGLEDRAASPFLLAIIVSRRDASVLDAFLERMSKEELNTVSECNQTRVPDALLVALHPLCRRALVRLLRVGLRPCLEQWCQGERSLLRVLTESFDLNARVALVRTLLKFDPFSMRCCDRWANTFGDRWTEIAALGEVRTLRELCRMKMASVVPTKRLVNEQWVKEVHVPKELEEYLEYDGELEV